jgi:biopolymer transport protein ExbB
MLNTVFLQIPTAGSQVAKDTVQAGINAATTAPVPTETSLSLWELVVKGGPIMIPIAVMFLLAVFYFVERLLVLSKAKKADPALMLNVKSAIQKGDIEAAKAFCRNSHTPQAKVLEKGVSRIGLDIKDIKSDMDDAGQIELHKLERNMSAISITAKIAPMFGFIGTIAGVIKIFYDISLADNISIGLIASGLYQKMITSAGGLVVGVIAFVAYHWLNTMIDKAIYNMNNAKLELMDVLTAPAK